MNKKHLETSIFSFFAGSGLLDLGFEAANFNVVYASEISPAFMKAYSYARKCIGIAYPKHGCHTGEDGDITNILKTSHIISDLLKEERKSSKIIGFLGGSPCPDFSIGGKNRGQEGEHGKLSGSYIELICLHQPDFFVFENVKGLWKTKRHRDFYEGLKFKLYKTGYILTERLINAIEYGVPQDRERVILIGFSKFFLNSLGFKTINLNYISEKEFPWKNYINYNKDKIFSCAWPERSPFIEDSIFDCPDNLPQELTVEYWFRKNDVFHHPNSVHCFQPRQGLKDLCLWTREMIQKNLIKGFIDGDIRQPLAMEIMKFIFILIKHVVFQSRKHLLYNLFLVNFLCRIVCH